MGAHEDFMAEAIAEAYAGIRAGHGGPFGAVVVKDGAIVGRGHNRVVADNDPTCHGEIDAIRDACARLGTFDLTGCDLYTTGESCQMCLAACIWAHIKTVYYGCTLDDNAEYGFRDIEIEERMGQCQRDPDYLKGVGRAACRALFDDYLKTQHTLY